VVIIITRMFMVSAAQRVWGIRQSNRVATRDSVSRWRATASLPTTVSVLIVLCTLSLWFVSLRWVDVNAMDDLGLVSVLPASSIMALAGLTLGFCLIPKSLEDLQPLVLLSYLLTLIFMLYATPALIEQAPRFDVTYWLAGHTDYVLRNGTVDPYLDAYFNWPGFFVLTGILAKFSGVSSVLAFAPWASFVYNLLYFAPMYLIFSTFTQDRRTVWLGLWFFYITDWVWQDYFDPQGLNFFFYLVIIAILLKGFQTARSAPGAVGRSHAAGRRLFSRSALRPTAPIECHEARTRSVWMRIVAFRPMQAWASNRGFPGYVDRFRRWAALSDVPDTREQHRKRIVLLCTVIAVFTLSVFSHPITPFFILLSVTALTLFGTITPRWLPILFAAMIVGWDFTAAMPYVAGHLRSDLASFANFQVLAKTNVSDRLVAGSADHQLVSHLRVLTSAAVWGLAILGFLLRWRANASASCRFKRDIGTVRSQEVTLFLLVAAPVLLVIAQPYGGEMAMRYYLFTLPIVSFLAATTFRTRITVRRWGIGKLSRWVVARSVPFASVAAVVTCLVLLGGFLFARYGNERADYVTFSEANAVAYLYSVAPTHSLLLAGWDGTPWRYQDLELYTYSKLYTGADPAAAFEAHDVQSILDRASDAQYPAVYVIFSRSQKAQAQLYAGVPAATFTAVERALLTTGRFSIVYSNPDADVLVYSHLPATYVSPHPRGIQRGRS
jgi:hypothetical protein